MPRLRIELAYDGAPFAGWARQPGLPSVQAVVEGALGMILNRPVKVTVAGRTDAGVHARGQVVHADLDEREWASLSRAHRRAGDGKPGAQRGAVSAAEEAGRAVARRLNGVIPLLLTGKLPADRVPEESLITELGLDPRGGHAEAAGSGVDRRVAERRRRSLRASNADRAVWITSVEPVSEDFDARFSALARRYSYEVADAETGFDPLGRGRQAWVPERLDVAAMREAAQAALGLQDFLSFCKPREGATTTRQLSRLDVARRPDGVVVFGVEADAFCHHMVRSLVGALLKVGTGERDGRWFAELVAAPRRDGAVVMAPGHALVLEEVMYPEPARWAERAEQTRDKRG